MPDTVKLLQDATAAIDALPARLDGHREQRRDLRRKVESGEVGDHELTLRAMIDEGLGIRRAVAALDLALKNAMPVIEKLEKDAAKDYAWLAERIAQGKSKVTKKAGSGFRPWSHPVYAAQREAVETLVKKIEYAMVDYKSLHQELNRMPQARNVPELQMLLEAMDEHHARLRQQLANAADNARGILVLV